jgi:SecD/SecF fusion protein
MLIDANTEVKKILNPVLADTTAGDTTKKDNKIVDKKVAEDVKTTQTDTTKKDSVSLSNLLGTGESKSDSLLTANDSLENFKKENPLFYVLKLNLDQQGAPYEGPICGFANVKDTAEVMFYLTREKVARVLPPNIRFMWGNKALKGFLPNYLPLYAIKVSDRNGKAALFGDIITRARVEFDQSNKGNASVSMSMTDEAASTWATLTKANKGKAIAIVLDNLVYSAPNVMNEITGGQSSITGDFSLNEAEDLANILSAGKLPASAKIVEESIVGPTLGKESIKSGLISFIIALLWLFIMVVPDSLLMLLFLQTCFSSWGFWLPSGPFLPFPELQVSCLLLVCLLTRTFLCLSESEKNYGTAKVSVLPLKTGMLEPSPQFLTPT